MYKFIENLNEKEYEDFVYNNKKAHFMQSYDWGLVQKVKHFKPYYVGIKKDNVLLGTALLLEKKILKNYGYIYCPRGFIIDYENIELIKVFTIEIKNFLKKHKDIFFRMDPDIKLHNLDINGNIIDEFDNTNLINYFKKLGYIHKGFNKNFENNQPRYTFRLDLNKSIDDIFRGFHPTTKNILNKGNIYDLCITKNNIADINNFYTTMVETAKRENIVPSSIEYYKSFYEILHKDNMSDLYTITVDISKLKEKYKFLIEESQEQIIKLKENKNQKKANNLINDINDKLKKLKKELIDIDNIKEKILPLSSMITAKYKDKVWTVHGGNHSLLRELNANYLLYYEIIKDANKEGYKTIDFFGTTGNQNPNNYIYGIHLFKKRLGGEYTEFIGEFELVDKKILYFMYNKYLKFKKKLRKWKKHCVKVSTYGNKNFKD